MSTGVTFTTLASAATVTGIVLTSVGCSDEEKASLCRAGSITLGTGSAVLAGSIFMMVKAMAQYELRPLLNHGETRLSLTANGLKLSY